MYDFKPFESLFKGLNSVFVIKFVKKEGFSLKYGRIIE
jgi:hypothetical protein